MTSLLSWKAVIAKAIEEDPDVRYQHASEMTADLKRIKRDADSGRSVASAPVAARASPVRRRAMVGAAVVGLVAALAGAGLFYRSHMGGPIDSVAVLPFANASRNPDSECLSDGITESLINSLSTLPHLGVMSHDSAFMYKGKDTDARAVANSRRARCS